MKLPWLKATYKTAIVHTQSDTAGEPSATMSAAQRVFDVAELFDAIIFDLDMRELFINQRVSRHWLNWIKSSKPLRKKMFLTPGPQATDFKDVQSNPFITRIIMLESSDNTCTAWSHPSASWRHMLLFRPGLKNATLTAYFSNKTRKYTIDRVEGSWAWRSTTMDGFFRQVRRMRTEEEVMMKTRQTFTISAVVQDEQGPSTVVVQHWL